MTCDASRIRGLASTDGQLRCVWTGGPSTSTSAEKADSRRDHARFRHQAAWRKALEEGRVSNPVQARPNDLATDRSSKAGGGHHQTVVFLWDQGARSAPTVAVLRAPNAILCGLDVESEGTQQVHRALNSVRFLVRRVGRPVQPSTWPQRKQGREWWEQVVGVAQVDLQRGLCGRAWRQSALVGPSDAQRVSKSERRSQPSASSGLGHRLSCTTPCVLRTHRSAKAAMEASPGRSTASRRLNVPDGEMHACVAQFARPSARFGDAGRERKMQGTARLALKTNLAVHGLERTGEKEC